MLDLRRFFRSFVVAGAGLWEAVRYEQNFRVHMVVAVGAVGFSVWLGLTAVEMSIIVLCCGGVLALELVNTAVERVVDRVSPGKHELARQAKDCAAAAVLMGAGTSLVIAGFLWGPRLWALAGG